MKNYRAEGFSALIVLIKKAFENKLFLKKTLENKLRAVISVLP